MPYRLDWHTQLDKTVTGSIDPAGAGMPTENCISISVCDLCKHEIRFAVRDRIDEIFVPLAAVIRCPDANKDEFIS